MRDVELCTSRLYDRTFREVEVAKVADGTGSTGSFYISMGDVEFFAYIVSADAPVAFSIQLAVLYCEWRFFQINGSRACRFCIERTCSGNCGCGCICDGCFF